MTKWKIVLGFSGIINEEMQAVVDVSIAGGRVEVEEEHVHIGIDSSQFLLYAFAYDMISYTAEGL